MREGWHSDEGGRVFTLGRLDERGREEGSWAFVQGENSTRFRVLAFDEPGNDTGESGVLIGSNRVLGKNGFLRDEVDGGLGGRASGIDMIAGLQSKFGGCVRH